MRVLLVAPSDDISSQSVARWAERLYNSFWQSVSMYLLNPKTVGAKLTRATVAQELKNYTHVFYFGHGQADSLYIPKMVVKDEILIDNQNVDDGGYASRVVVAVACWSGDTLGPGVAGPGSSQQVAAYVGWPVELSWPASADKPFEDAIVAGLGQLLSGGTVADMIAELQKSFCQAHNDYKTKLLSSSLGKDKIRLAMLQASYWNQHVKKWGDGSAKL